MADAALSPRSPLARAARPVAPAAEPGVTLSERRPDRVIALLARRDAERALADACRASGVTLPEAPRRLSGRGHAVVWFGPRQWLVEADMAEADRLGRLFVSLGSLCSTVTLDDSRVVLSIAGPAAPQTLAKIVGIDLHPRAFSADAAAVTAAGGISVVVWRIDGGFECAVPRSMAGSVWDWLIGSAAEYGVTARRLDDG